MNEIEILHLKNGELIYKFFCLKPEDLQEVKNLRILIADVLLSNLMKIKELKEVVDEQV